MPLLKIDNDLIDLLDSIPDDTPKENVADFHSSVVDCPTCNEKYRLTFNVSEIVYKIGENGIANVHASFPCGHDFVMHVDKNIKIRGFIPITSGIHITTERLDVRYLRDAEKKLTSYHEKLVAEKDDRAFKIFQELKRIRKYISSLS